MKRWIAMIVLGMSPTVVAEKYITSSDDLKPIPIQSQLSLVAAEAVKQVEILGVYPGMTITDLEKHYSDLTEVKNNRSVDSFADAQFGYLAANYVQVDHPIFRDVGVGYMMYIESTRYAGRVDLIRFKIRDLPRFKKVFHQEISQVGAFDEYVARRFHEYPKTTFHYELKLDIPMTEAEESVLLSNESRKHSAEILDIREKVSETFK